VGVQYTSNRVSCWYTNPTSLNNKLDELEVIADTYGPDLIFICETWFKSDSVVNINGYNIFRLDRVSHGGGVCIYAKKSLRVLEVKNAVLNNQNVEQIWCTLDIGQENILLGCIYRPNMTGVNDGQADAQMVRDK
jgi:hypothetical protein